MSRVLLSNRDAETNAVFRSFSGDMLVPLPLARDESDNLFAAGYEATFAALGLVVAPDVAADGIPRISQVRTKRDAEGRMAEVRFLDAFGRPACLKNGWFGMAFHYDAQSRITECFALDKDGARCKEGLVGCKYYYSGSEVSMMCPLARDGSLFVDVSLRGGSCYARDKWGNAVKYNNFVFQPDGQLLCINDSMGVMEERMAYDDHGYCTNVVSFGLQSQMEVPHVLSSVCFRHDDLGRIVLSVGVDMKTGVESRIRYKYDKLGRLLRMENVNEMGCVVNDINGVSIVSFEYDGLIEQASKWRTYNKDGALCPSGIAGARNAAGFDVVYTDSGLRVRQTAIGTNGAPVISEEKGYAKVAYVHDAQGRHVETEYYYDDMDRPVRDRSRGVYGIRYVYDKDRDVRIAVEYVDANGDLMADANGVAGYKSKFDASGREVCRRYYNRTRMLPAADKNESYGWDEIRDANGKISREPVGRFDFRDMPRRKKSTLPDSAPKLRLNNG